MARGTIRCWRTRSLRAAASRCSHSARRCTRPGCASATWSRRPGAHARTAQGAPVQHLQHRALRCQQAIAGYLAERPQAGAGLAPFFQAKRDRLRSLLADSGFGLPPAQGTYFQLLDFGAFAPPDDLAFAERLLTEARVASIPLSPFYEKPEPLTFVRLCIAKKDSTLDEAGARLDAFARRLRQRS